MVPLDIEAIAADPVKANRASTNDVSKRLNVTPMKLQSRTDDLLQAGFRLSASRTLKIQLFSSRATSPIRTFTKGPPMVAYRFEDSLGAT